LASFEKRNFFIRGENKKKPKYGAKYRKTSPGRGKFARFFGASALSWKTAIGASQHQGLVLVEKRG